MATTLSPLYLPTTGTHHVTLGSSLKRKFSSLSSPAAENPRAPRRQRRQEQGAEFHAVQFGRQPESVDPSRGTTFELSDQLADGSTKVQAERQSASGERFLFTGTQQPSKARDCLLVYDPATRTFTLELLTSSTTLTYDRSATNALKRQAGLEVSTTPSGSGSGSGPQSIVPPGDEPTPLSLGEAAYEDVDAEGDPDEELRLDESPVNRDTNTSDETYVNADADPELDDPPAPAPAPALAQRRPQPAYRQHGYQPQTQPAPRGLAYEEIDLDLGAAAGGGGYVSEDSDLLAEGDGEADADADGVTDADAEGVTDADADADEDMEEVLPEQDADEELEDFLLADLTSAAQDEQEQEDEPEQEQEPEPRSRRRRSSTATATAHPPTSRPQPPALRPLALPTARRMSLRSATTQAIHDVHSASTLPVLGQLNGTAAEKKWDDDSDSDSEDDDDEEDDPEADGSFAAGSVAGAPPGEGEEGEDSDFDFLAADMQADDVDAAGEEEEEGAQEESPLAKQSRGRTARQLDIWDEEDE
ncbi:hypothetical protein CALCODRAFT_488069 [Calocera cornea HHB12733]|uniref:Transcription elongation factor Eaf N-terminal domain-containing protein n=1 Tax=Calocera cornea HHB12733 TaxID=1353952 RepID=A0A165CRN9_9BASI|nr:hypothetical protein CALCODRAFT_488069 [Calocera cornea HHB12733]